MPRVDAVSPHLKGGYKAGPGIMTKVPVTLVVRPNELVDRWRTHYGTEQWKTIEKLDKAGWMLKNENAHTLALAFTKKAKCVPVKGEEEASEVSDLGSSDDVDADADLAVDVGRRAGGGMSTAGGFSVSAGSNTAGNDEALADLDLGDSGDPVVSKAMSASAKAQAAANSAVKSKSTSASKAKAGKPTMKCTVTKSCRVAQANLPAGITDITKDRGFKTECLLF
jgi:hypothetical protein